MDFYGEGGVIYKNEGEAKARMVEEFGMDLSWWRKNGRVSRKEEEAEDLERKNRRMQERKKNTEGKEEKRKGRRKRKKNEKRKRGKEKRIE